MRSMTTGFGLSLAVALIAASGLIAAGVDEKLPSYTPTSGVSGQLKSIGSDTMNNLMTLWAEKFIEFYPNVTVEIEGKGSTTAPPALVAGTAAFGPMSRAMNEKEVDQFEKKYGYKPTELRTAIDMLAVFVHKDNPIAETGLTLQQLDAIFSKTRRGGASAAITTWGQLGLTGEWADKPISLYGRNSASGTYGYFKEKALFKGDFNDAVKEQPGSSSVVQGVASDKFAIGYSGIGYITADVKAVKLAKDADTKMSAASAEDVSTYPLARFLYVYVNHKPLTEMDPMRREFVKLIFSKEGQEVVLKDGFLPVPAGIAAAELKKIGAELGN